jgi:hypothetical protein
LLKHPRPIKRDTAKAQRMLGLIADQEEHARNLQRERSLTTRWLERPMYEHLEVSDVEEENTDHGEEFRKEPEEKPVITVQQEKVSEDGAVQEIVKEDSDSDLLDKWTNPNRPTSSINAEVTLNKFPVPKTTLDTSFLKRRPVPLSRPVSYNPQHLLSAEWIASPATMSPNTPGQRTVSSHLDSPAAPRSSMSSRGSCECEHPRIDHATWTYPPANRQADTQTERLISYRPQSFASFDSPSMQSRQRPTSYHQKNRSSSRIASSRGLRNNSFPMNFSRPMSGVAPRAIAGENIENDMVYQQFADDEVGPPTPHTSLTPATPIASTLDGFEAHEEKKRKSKRWSTIPQAFKKISSRRRDSAAAQEQTELATVVNDLRRANLTEENLHHYETEAIHDPPTVKRLSATKTPCEWLDHIPTPTYSPFDVQPPHFEAEGALPPPFAPWADGPPSPAATVDRRRSSGNSLSPRTAPSCLSVENVPNPRPVSLHSQRSSVAFPNTAPPLHRPTIDTSVSPRTTTPSSRRNTPTLERSCIICKVAKSPYAFAQRRITANCWHEPATCVGCMQSWVAQCFRNGGWEACTCPECGEGMAMEEVGVFAEVLPL